MKYLSIASKVDCSVNRYIRKTPRLCLALLICFVICISSVSAQSLIIEAEGAYTIGDGLNENIAVAKERAKAEALRNASEKASVFVESLTVVKEGMVNKDEIRVISANVMQVQGSPKFKAVPVSDDVIRYECFVTVAVDTDNINAAMIKDKSALAAAVEKNKQLTGEIERLNGEMEKLKNRYKTASTEKEKEEIRKEVKRNDENFEAARLNEEGAKLYEQGRYGDAIQYFTQAIAKNPQFAFAYHNRGSAYGKMNNYAQAIADFSQAITLDKNYASAYSGRGFAYYGIKQYENAARDFSKAISVNSSYAEAYYGRGNVYMILGHYEEAARDYEKALSINPNLDAARTNLNMILTAK